MLCIALGSLLVFLWVQNNRASQMKFIADRKVPKFRKGVHSGHNSRMVIAQED
jgi:hypothetical protein